MQKVLFIIKDKKITGLMHETLDMQIPSVYDYILWVPLNKWIGNHVRFIANNDESVISDLEPKVYKYEKSVWDEFKAKIRQ